MAVESSESTLPEDAASQKTRQYTCSACGTMKAAEAFAKYDSRNLHARCLTCEFPHCANASCNRKRKEKEGPVPACEVIQGKWYCEQNQCQGQRPRHCDHCKKLQDVGAFRKTHHAETTCLQCQYPECKACGHQHSGRTLRKDATGWIDQEWYCKKCERAAKRRRIGQR